MQTRKALLIPINSRGEILIQDRRGYKMPDWGFFGGTVEEGETTLQAMLREAKEELDLDLNESNLTNIGSYKKPNDLTYDPDFFVYKTDQEVFEDREAAGAHWCSLEKARELLDIGDRFDDVLENLSVHIN